VLASIQLVLALLFGVAGWHHARNLERKYGTAAWGMPSWVWGIITGISLLLGAILLLIAERGLKKQPQQSFPQVPSYATAPVGYGAEAAPAAQAAPSAVPAGWQPDPSGKYQHRWWDGQRWTNSVSTNGITGVDS
jgi:hypothetical protein